MRVHVLDLVPCRFFNRSVDRLAGGFAVGDVDEIEGRQFRAVACALAFEKVGPEGAAALETDLLAYLERVNSSERALVIEPAYLQLVAIRA